MGKQKYHSSIRKEEEEEEKKKKLMTSAKEKMFDLSFEANIDDHLCLSKLSDCAGPGPSAVIEPRDLRFHVKIVFLVTEIFVFCIQAKVTYCRHSLNGLG